VTGSISVDSMQTLRAAPQTAQPAPQSGMNDMMKMHEKMMSDMKAAEARLDALAKTMNAASGDAKTNAIAAVVNELVAQHKSMHAHMNEMHQQMMGGRGMMMMKD
jgi:vancomycin resistance protein YoaR